VFLLENNSHQQRNTTIVSGYFLCSAVRQKCTKGTGFNSQLGHLGACSAAIVLRISLFERIKLMMMMMMIMMMMIDD
jgi:hypothetical protein